jgi:coenzyme F420-reducing hydrogenase beta subunit
MPSCRTCTDFTAELADLSVGSAYPLEGCLWLLFEQKQAKTYFTTQ